ncbi:phosphatase PAP2 family protein [Caulobacter sp. KR2-114]|uniref:phosphatase PAP2 family protein n=1 Tax=Caulobacter sp. KR2-114 TaxID=3400912 RepID=UPI003C002A24
MTDPAPPDIDAPASAPAGPQAAQAVRWLWPLLLLAGAGALGLAIHLIDEIAEGERFRLDTALLLALRQPGHPGVPIGPAWLLQSAIDVSALGGFTLQWLLGGAACLFLVAVRRRAEAAWLAVSLAGASAINTGLKSLIDRPRPQIVPHLAQVSNASFPSGHAMISAAVYLTAGAMLCEAMPLRRGRLFVMLFAGLLVVLIGASRVYLGVHWPSDVLAGWCLGGLWALAVFAADRWLRRRSARAAIPRP